MGKILTYRKQVWDVTSGSGTGGGKKKAFEESSPADPVTVLQCYAQFVGVDGGDATSKVHITVDEIIDLFGGTPIKIPLQIHRVGDAGGTPVETYVLHDGAGAPSSGLHKLRIGNFDYADAKKLRMFAENFEFTFTNPGTAYTAGTLNIIPIGYIVTA